MSLIPLNPPPGLNSDDTTFSAQGRWADGNNVRFRLGRPETIGGWLATGITGLTGAIRNITYLTADAHYRVGTDSRLYRDTTNISPTPGVSGVLFWSLQHWGSILLASPSGGKLYEQTGATAATAVAAAPARITVMLVTPERQVLALGCNEEVSTNFNSLCIRGSDLEDYTDWTTTSTNNAFEHILDYGGAIVGAVCLSQVVAVFTQDILYQGTFIGDPSQAYRFDRVASGCPLLNIGAVTTYQGYAYWVGPDLQLKRWTPGTLPETIPCPILRDVSNNINTEQKSKVRVWANSRFGEIWIFYPDARDTAGVDGGGQPILTIENSRYFAYSLLESAAAQSSVWFRGQLARSAFFDSGLNSDVSTASTLVMGNTLGTVYLHEETATHAPDVAYIQSADYALSNSQQRMMVKSFIPDFEYQSGDVSLTLFMRDRPQSAPVTKGPYTIANTATKKDFRASGKVAATKISATNVRFRLGQPLFDTVALGQR